jgi:hypothetical protein
VPCSYSDLLFLVSDLVLVRKNVYALHEGSFLSFHVSACCMWTKAMATLEPEPTQHNSLDRLQIGK